MRQAASEAMPRWFTDEFRERMPDVVARFSGDRERVPARELRCARARRCAMRICGAICIGSWRRRW